MDDETIGERIAIRLENKPNATPEEVAEAERLAKIEILERGKK